MENISNNRITTFLNSIGSINRYMLLNRLQSDCEYFLGNGNRFKKHLWAGNVDDHIRYMKYLYLKFPINEKPEWITMGNILDYENRMKNN